MGDAELGGREVGGGGVLGVGCEHCGRGRGGSAVVRAAVGGPCVQRQRVVFEEARAMLREGGTDEFVDGARIEADGPAALALALWGRGQCGGLVEWFEPAIGDVPDDWVGLHVDRSSTLGAVVDGCRHRLAAVVRGGVVGYGRQEPCCWPGRGCGLSGGAGRGEQAHACAPLRSWCTDGLCG